MGWDDSRWSACIFGLSLQSSLHYATCLSIDLDCNPLQDQRDPLQADVPKLATLRSWYPGFFLYPAYLAFDADLAHPVSFSNTKKQDVQDAGASPRTP